MKVSVGDPVEVVCGGLRFVVMNRTIDDDGGTSIEIYPAGAARGTQVLRFDCFRKQPHYHAPPGARDGSVADRQIALDPGEVGDGLEWALAQTRYHLPELLREAGFAELARALDPADFETGWERVRDAVRAAPPPARSFELELPAAGA